MNFSKKYKTKHQIKTLEDSVTHFDMVVNEITKTGHYFHMVKDGASYIDGGIGLFKILPEGGFVIMDHDEVSLLQKAPMFCAKKFEQAINHLLVK